GGAGKRRRLHASSEFADVVTGAGSNLKNGRSLRAGFAGDTQQVLLSQWLYSIDKQGIMTARLESLAVAAHLGRITFVGRASVPCREEVHIPLPSEVEVMVARAAQGALCPLQRVAADRAGQDSSAGRRGGGGAAPVIDHRARTICIST